MDILRVTGVLDISRISGFTEGNACSWFTKCSEGKKGIGVTGKPRVLRVPKLLGVPRVLWVLGTATEYHFYTVPYKLVEECYVYIIKQKSKLLELNLFLVFVVLQRL